MGELLAVKVRWTKNPRVDRNITSRSEFFNLYICANLLNFLPILLLLTKTFTVKYWEKVPAGFFYCNAKHASVHIRTRLTWSDFDFSKYASET